MPPTLSKQQAALQTALESIEIDDKKIINCPANPNQLVPLNYRWAWNKYLDMSNYVSDGAQEISALRPK